MLVIFVLPTHRYLTIAKQQALQADGGLPSTVSAAVSLQQCRRDMHNRLNISSLLATEMIFNKHAFRVCQQLLRLGTMTMKHTMKLHLEPASHYKQQHYLPCVHITRQMQTAGLQVDYYQWKLERRYERSMTYKVGVA
jgi:hypothetical protein